MSIRFFLANPKADKSSLVAIVSHNGNRYKKGIGLSLERNAWDKDNQKIVMSGKTEEEILNRELDKWRDNISLIMKNMDNNRTHVRSSRQFWKMVTGRMDGFEQDYNYSAIYLTDYMREVFIPRFENIKTQSRIARFKSILNKLLDYENTYCVRIKMSEVNILFYRSLQQYMNSLNHSTNYFGAIIKIIKQVMLEAKNIDTLHDNNQFLHSNFKAITQDIDTIYLNSQELSKIYMTEIDDNFILSTNRIRNKNTKLLKKRYEIVKNRFLIGAFTGLRLSDFNKIDNGNIADGKITVITEKTDQRVVIPIHPIVKNIINRGFNLKSSVSEATMRKYIKDICRYAGIDNTIEIRESIGGRVVINRYQKWELVGTHTARRSFATNAYKGGVPTIAIMKLTGHSKESTFMKYIRISEDENADMLAKHDFFTAM